MGLSENLVLQLWGDVGQSSKGLNWRHLWQNQGILLCAGSRSFISSFKTQSKRLAWRFGRTFFSHTIFFLKNLVKYNISIVGRKNKKEKAIHLTGIEMLSHVPWLYLPFYPVLATSGQHALYLQMKKFTNIFSTLGSFHCTHLPLSLDSNGIVNTSD